MKDSEFVTSVRYLDTPQDIGRLPVLTDVLVASTTPSGRTLWLAWDERRVPVLGEVVDARQAAADAPMRLWRGK